MKLTTEEIAELRKSLEFDRDRVGAPGCAVRRRAAWMLELIDRSAVEPSGLRVVARLDNSQLDHFAALLSWPHCWFCGMPLAAAEESTDACPGCGADSPEDLRRWRVEEAQRIRDIVRAAAAAKELGSGGWPTVLVEVQGTVEPMPHCQGCGCTDTRACEGGCSWANAEHTSAVSAAYSTTGRTMSDRCSTRCDHDSQCTLLAGHGDRHETDHGCICYDPTRGGVAGDFCGPGNECGRLGCLECQQ